MDKFNLDNETHPLILGKSFDKKPTCAFHSFRYDFKPASVDTCQVSNVEIGESNSVTVSVPHVEGSGTSHTVYKGNKRPCQKECVLIIDHRTGEFTLEKLANTIQLKKTRLEGHSKIRPSTPVDPAAKQKDVIKPPQQHPSPVKKPVQSHSQVPPQTQPSSHDHKDSSDSSSSNSDSSDSEDDHVTRKPLDRVEKLEARNVQRPFHSTLISEDLRLSESGSDSD